MKPLKPRNSLKPVLQPCSEIRSVRELRDFQRQMTEALFLPLTPGERLRPRGPDGRKMADVAAEFIKPNDRLTSFERLEIYSRSYWFRVLNAFYEDFPGLREALGERAFNRLAEAYLVKYPSESFTLRNLGNRLEKFLLEEPAWTGARFELALDVARFEWAQVVAFDGAGEPPLDVDELLGADPSKLKLGLQPYLTLLACRFPVDDFIMAMKRRNALRTEASNAKTSAPPARHSKKLELPKSRKIFLAVHRHHNTVYHKRLEPEAFALLEALRRGAAVGRACAGALKSASPERDWAEQIKAWFATWSALGWFCHPL